MCVPKHMAVVLTYPERVTAHNIEKLRRRVLNGEPVGRVWWCGGARISLTTPSLA